MSDPLEFPAMSDRRAVACNYAEGISAVRAGAKCYVSLTNPGAGDRPDRIQVLARSRGGRWIVKWEATKRLTNFRAVTIPAEHPLYADERVWYGDAARVAYLLGEPRPKGKP